MLTFQIAVKHFLFFLPIPTAGGETKSKEKNIQEQVRLNNRWVLGGGGVKVGPSTKVLLTLTHEQTTSQFGSDLFCIFI